MGRQNKTQRPQVRVNQHVGKASLKPSESIRSGWVRVDLTGEQTPPICIQKPKDIKVHTSNLLVELSGEPSDFSLRVRGAGIVSPGVLREIVSLIQLRQGRSATN